MKKIIYLTADFIQKTIAKNIILFLALGLLQWGAVYFENFKNFVEVFQNYVIPLSLALTAGNLIDKKHGGAGSVIGIALLITQKSIFNLIEIIILSSLISWTIKIFKEKIPPAAAGFEMIIINITVPLIAAGYYLIFLKSFQLIKIFSLGGFNHLSQLFDGVIGLCILTVFIETGKIFFINNFINHGFLTILGYSQLLAGSSSIFFFLEINPGPGLGILAAVYAVSKDRNVLSNMVMEFFGGIHELYFQYVLKRLKLLLPLILGGLTGNISAYLFDSFLIAVPSPGSFFLIILLAAENKRFYVGLSIILSAAVSFFTAYVLLKSEEETVSKKEKILEYSPLEDIKKRVFPSKVQIYIACTGGMGSSYIGKTILENIIKNSGRDNITVTNIRIGDNNPPADIVIAHKNFKSRVEEQYPESIFLGIDNYADKKIYQELADSISILPSPEEKKTDDKDIYHSLDRESLNRKEAVKELSLHMNIEKTEDNIILGNCAEVFFSSSSQENKIFIHHYPYGIIEDENIFLLIGIKATCEEMKEKFIRRIDNILNDENIKNELEISNDENYFLEIFNRVLEEENYA